MAKQDRHLTTARLSAFIDGQLSAEEQAQSEEHLRTCEMCQQQLAELRQTIALLHALPQPKLPRSFTLPVADPTITTRTNPTPHPLTPVTQLRQRGGRPVYASGAIRIISTLAAVIGIVFLLSGLFGTVIGVHGGAGSSAGVANSGSQNKPSIPHVVTPHETITAVKKVTPTPTNAPSVTSPGTSNHQAAQQNQQQPLLSILNLSMPGSRALIGLVLVVLGIIGFVVLGRRV